MERITSFKCVPISKISASEPLDSSTNTDMHRMWTIILQRGSGRQGPPHQRTQYHMAVSFGGPRADGQSADGTTWLCATQIAARGEEWFIRLCSHQSTFLWLRVSRREAWRGRDRQPPCMRHGILTTAQMGFPEAAKNTFTLLYCLQHTHLPAGTWKRNVRVVILAPLFYSNALAGLHTLNTHSLRHSRAKIKTYWAGLDIHSADNRRIWWIWVAHCLTCLYGPLKITVPAVQGSQTGYHVQWRWRLLLSCNVRESCRIGKQWAHCCFK